MKERPILFSGPMVRAILDGRKTQTRRIVKQSAARGEVFANVQECRQVEYQVGSFWLFFDEVDTGHDQDLLCPFGTVGDRLWVREAWQRFSNGNATLEAIECRADVFYQADESDPDTVPLSGRWRSPIHMPRWASRIDMEITGVRVERLQEISEGDAIAEGMPSIDMPLSRFMFLWNQINGPGSWDANPWVWVLEFRRIEK